MAYTAVRLGQAAIDTSASTIYTTPASTTTIVKSIDICNTTATATTIRVHLVPSGGSIGTGNAFLYDYSMAGNTFLCSWYGRNAPSTSWRNRADNNSFWCGDYLMVLDVMISPDHWRFQGMGAGAYAQESRKFMVQQVAG